MPDPHVAPHDETRFVRHAAGRAAPRRPYRAPRLILWGALAEHTRGGPAAGSDESMTGSTTFGFLFFGTDEWHLFGRSGGR